ncbi:zinc finger protein constans-like 5 [Phtheirospermum japonicum]|uniref:Zinc finger protein constans-like 5 n=1 Tax=Phtheirospermum japonicum TaxID=374723 RepID=A0A830BN06_9LAMI|nr:zinc finger protein constans-like 5 [Phtheirospermum japonicum]
MSSDLFIFDNSFFSDPFPTFTDPAISPHPYEILQEIQDDPIQENNNPIDETSSFDQIASAFLSPSPPRAELENLSLSQLEKTEYSVKTEQCQFNFDGFSGFGNCASPHSFDSAYETAVKFMQRSYSSNCFENNQNLTFHPRFDCVFESQDLQNQILSSPETGFSAGGQIRRVCSTGDLQNVKTNMETKNVLSSSPLSTEKSLMEEANFKVGRYSAEERKERIDRYRAKRTQRNFNKTIKYACRKTLADNRPRVRGRFARNDEAGEIPKASMFHRYEDEDDLWIDGFHEEIVDGIAKRGTLFNISGSGQYQNYSY